MSSSTNSAANSPQGFEVKQLAFIRHLYNVGLEQANQPEPLNTLSLLLFHDAAELFLHLSAMHLSISKENIGFMEYWDIINNKLDSDEITQKEPMRSLNRARVNLKHHRTLPSKLNIDEYRTTITIFFNENIPKIFGIDFGFISMVDLVSYKKTKLKLLAAQNSMQNGNANEAIIEISESFIALFHDHAQTTQIRSLPPSLYFGQSSVFEHGFLLSAGADMDELIGEVEDAISSIQNTLRILIFGFDYRRYLKFMSLTAQLRRGRLISTLDPPKTLSIDECKFCFDFVIDCALKLQNFD